MRYSPAEVTGRGSGECARRLLRGGAGADGTLFPAFGFTVTFRQNLAIGLVFTAVSIVRSYTLRRLFEVWRTRA